MTERGGSYGKLDAASFAAGQESAAERWSESSDPSQGSVAPSDRRALLFALYHSPLAGLEGQAAFLVRRSLISEVSVELLACPHCVSSGGSAVSVVDELCRQQFEWLRGYFGFLNPSLVPALARQGAGRCVVSW